MALTFYSLERAVAGAATPLSYGNYPPGIYRIIAQVSATLGFWVDGKYYKTSTAVANISLNIKVRAKESLVLSNDCNGTVTVARIDDRILDVQYA